LGADPTSKETTMRSRIVVFVALAVVTALVGVYVGWSTNTPKAVGEPATTTQPTRRWDPPSGGLRLRAVALTYRLLTEGRRAEGRCEPGRHRHPAGPAATDAARVAAAAQHRPGALRQGDDHAVGRHDRHQLAPDDHRALTTTFDNIQVGNEEPPKPDAARTFAMTLPLTEGAKGETLRFYVQASPLPPRASTCG
jgi:hypothetical protein